MSPFLQAAVALKTGKILFEVKRNMGNKDVYYFAAGIVTTIAAALIIFAGYNTLKKPHHEYLPTLGTAKSSCEIIANQLTKYYSQRQNDLNNISNADFFKYLSTNFYQFSMEAPEEKYASAYDYGVYLYLPSKLESEKSILIGNTTTFKWANKYMGIIFFLRGNDVLVVPLDEMPFKKIVGEKTGKADFYYWYHRLQYLSDNMPKRTAEIHSDANSK